MKKQFVTYEIALALEELGFNEPCFGFYVSNVIGNAFSLIQNGIGFKTNLELTADTHISAPLWQQVIDWFEEKHDITVTNRKFFNHAYQIYIPQKNKEAKLIVTGLHQTSRIKAINDGILVAIEMVKNRQINEKAIELCQKKK